MTNDARGVGATLREGRAEARDLGSEIAGIAADLKGLGRAEARLAAAEIRENIGFAVRGLAFAVVASVIGLMSIGFAGATAMIALSLIMPLWAAGLVLTATLAVLAGACALVARRLMESASITPRRTAASLKGNATWLANQLRFSAK
ncbi:MAG: phage holin family protein [Tepidiformaceae bacterium]